MKILLVEDHPKLRSNIVRFLKAQGVFPTEAITGPEAVEKFSSERFDAVILDLGLPLLDGKGVIRAIREIDRKTPVIVLTSSHLLEDKLELFDLGADDYVTKPFELAELYVRIRAGIRRSEVPMATHRYEIGDDIVVDFDRATVEKSGETIQLLNKELKILQVLVQKEGAICSKSELLEAVWGESDEVLFSESTTLETHISTIRKKLAKDVIITHRGIGYALWRPSRTQSRA